MKKNGRRARKLQKEKDARKQKKAEQLAQEKQQVDAVDIEDFAMSQMIEKNPILCDTTEMRMRYLELLKAHAQKENWSESRMAAAALQVYENALTAEPSETEPNPLEFYKGFFRMDCQFLREMARQDGESRDAVVNPEIKGQLGTSQEKTYCRALQKNFQFRRKIPYTLMITANMSAGKSTFINALTGKRICRSQTMACTSKIHAIVNKAFEDGLSYEYDHDLVLDAGDAELMTDNEKNTTSRIIVATKFRGGLRNDRLIVNDSPGVNFSGAPEHRKITEQMLSTRNYDLLVYLMNATQLGTTDEAAHLARVKRLAGKTPVLFVVNKMDEVDTEEEDVGAMLREQVSFLRENGFSRPLICPVSARAAFLAKQFQYGLLTRTEQRELYRDIEKFAAMNLPEYYAKAFPQVQITNRKQEENQLLKTSGFAYVEQIIHLYTQKEQ